MIQLLSRLSIPVLDRLAVERLFQVRRRRAITLMHHFGGYSAGNSALLHRLDLIQRLRDLALSPTVLHETVRKEKLAAHLVELERSRAGAQIKIGVRNPGERWRTELPPGIHISAGQLVVEYSSPDALFKTLYDFGQTAANNYDSVCDVLRNQGTTQ